MVAHANPMHFGLITLITCKSLALKLECCSPSEKPSFHAAFHIFHRFEEMSGCEQDLSCGTTPYERSKCVLLKLEIKSEAWF